MAFSGHFLRIQRSKMAAAAMMTANTLPRFNGLRPSAVPVKSLVSVANKSSFFCLFTVFFSFFGLIKLNFS